MFVFYVSIFSKFLQTWAITLWLYANIIQLNKNHNEYCVIAIYIGFNWHHRLYNVFANYV